MSRIHCYIFEGVWNTQLRWGDGKVLLLQLLPVQLRSIDLYLPHTLLYFCRSVKHTVTVRGRRSFATATSTCATPHSGQRFPTRATSPCHSSSFSRFLGKKNLFIRERTQKIVDSLSYSTYTKKFGRNPFTIMSEKILLFYEYIQKS